MSSAHSNVRSRPRPGCETRVRSRWTPIAPRTLAAVGVLFIAAALYPILSQGPTRTAPSTATSGYIDPSLCSQCHGDVAATYYSSGMGRTIFRATTKDVIEDYFERDTVQHRPSGLRYKMSEHDGHFFQSREQIGFDGALTNSAERKVDYVLGSGNHARTYLSQTPQGALLQLPVSWYSEGAGYWAMTSGFDRPGQADFRQPINSECLSCHSGSPLVLPRAGFADGTETLFRKDLPQGIDCQRCHGPGRAHYLAARTPGTSAERIRATIINPERLNRERQMDVCMQCHLQTGGRNVPSELRWFDRDVFSYKPGEPLGDFKLFFVQPEHVSDDTAPGNPNVVSAAYRLRKSACFRSSEMTCTTCHDPHKEYRTEGSTDHYVQVCEGCHRAVTHTVVLPAKSNCISCHMASSRVAPHNNSDDPIHISLTDHWIQSSPQNRTPQSPTVSDSGKLPGRVELYYPFGSATTPGSRLYLDLAQVIHGTDLQSSLTRLRDDLKKPPLGPVQFYLGLSRGYLGIGKMQEAAEWDETAIRTSPTSLPALKQYASLLLSIGKWRQATEVLQRAAQVSPGDSTVLDSLGYAFLQQGLPTEARSRLRRALDLDPEDAQACDLLGMVALKAGSPAEAAQQFREAVHRQPTLPEPHIHLAGVLAGDRSYQEAAFHLRLATTIDPASSEGHRMFGLVLMASRSYDQAIEELGKAAHLDPKDVQTHEDLGDLLMARKDLEAAAMEYQQAISLNPNHAGTHYSLGAVRATQRKTVEAEQEFRRSLQLDPALLEADLELGVVLVSEQKMAEARPYLERAAKSSDARVTNAANAALARYRQ